MRRIDQSCGHIQRRTQGFIMRVLGISFGGNLGGRHKKSLAQRRGFLIVGAPVSAEAREAKNWLSGGGRASRDQSFSPRSCAVLHNLARPSGNRAEGPIFRDNLLETYRMQS